MRQIFLFGLFQISVRIEYYLVDDRLLDEMYIVLKEIFRYVH